MNMQGCYTALVTPFRGGAVDYPALERLVEQQIAGGVAGIVPVGTTGESPTVTVEEHLKVIEFVAEKANHRCQIIAGTGANSTEEAIRLTKAVAPMGVDATLQVTPYYNKPSPEGLYRHFMTVAECAPMPIVLYNVPGRTGKEIPLEVVKRLAGQPQVAAIKEAGGSVERVNAIREMCDLTVLSGDDSLALPMMAVGAAGVISVLSNLVPAEVTEMCRLALANDFAAARRIHERFYPCSHALFIESNPIPVKAALADMGLIAEEYRLPLCEMAPANREILRAALRKSGIALKV
jgi:4-hydroxy-tetrahydrodipicolinate synthase